MSILTLLTLILSLHMGAWFDHGINIYFLFNQCYKLMFLFIIPQL